jgi:hypothetical protein
VLNQGMHLRLAPRSWGLKGRLKGSVEANQKVALSECEVYPNNCSLLCLKYPFVPLSSYLLLGAWASALRPRCRTASSAL